MSLNSANIAICTEWVKRLATYIGRSQTQTHYRFQQHWQKESQHFDCMYKTERAKSETCSLTRTLIHNMGTVSMSRATRCTTRYVSHVAMSLVVRCIHTTCQTLCPSILYIPSSLSCYFMVVVDSAIIGSYQPPTVSRAWASTLRNRWTQDIIATMFIRLQ